MNFSTYRFTLDLQKHQSQMSIAAFQYDTAIKLSIGLTDGGLPYYLEDGCIAVLYGKKANGEPIVHSCSIEANTRIIYEFNKETANELGIVDCQICFYKEGQQILSAPKFIIVVAKKAVNDADVYDSGDDNFSEKFSALDNLFVSESERVEAEKIRTKTENSRAEAEILRVESEQSRVEAESARVEAEISRVESEQSRVETENARAEAEESRVEVEASRVEAEEGRVEAEEGRVEAEASRVEAEKERQQIFSQVNLDKKLDKTTLPNMLYGTSSMGNQTYYQISSAVASNRVPKRDPNGDIPVNDTPKAENVATSKKYVDKADKALAEKQNALEYRVSNLESLTLSFPEVTSTDYEKAVPAEVGEYAFLKMIGGATKKCNNLIPFPYKETYKETTKTIEGITFTVADNGIVTLNGTTTLTSGVKDFILADSLYLPAGDYSLSGTNGGGTYTYRMFCWIKKADNTDFYVGDGSFTLSQGDYIYRLTLRFGYEIGTVNNLIIKPMLNEGSTVLPYEPYFEGFRNADVERVESIGKNRLPSDVMIADNWVTESGSAWKRYYLDLTDGWYCISLKLKEGYSGGAVMSLQKSVDGGKSYTTSKSCYNLRGSIADGYLLSATGLDNAALWFNVDKKAGIIYRLNFYNLSQSVLDSLYDMQIERVNLTQEPSSSYPPETYAPATEYVPYRAIDTITIPEAVRSKEGYGREGSYIEWVDGVATLTVTKDENLEELAKPIVTNITVPNGLQVQRGGAIRFVNEHEMPVPNTVAFTKRKE